MNPETISEILPAACLSSFIIIPLALFGLNRIFKNKADIQSQNNAKPELSFGRNNQLRDQRSNIHSFNSGNRGNTHDRSRNGNR